MDGRELLADPLGDDGNLPSTLNSGAYEIEKLLRDVPGDEWLLRRLLKQIATDLRMAAREADCHWLSKGGTGARREVD